MHQKQTHRKMSRKHVVVGGMVVQSTHAWPVIPGPLFCGQCVFEGVSQQALLASQQPAHWVAQLGLLGRMQLPALQVAPSAVQS
jgi:hypothetical protein